LILKMPRRRRGGSLPLEGKVDPKDPDEVRKNLLIRSRFSLPHVKQAAPAEQGDSILAPASSFFPLSAKKTNGRSVTARENSPPDCFLTRAAFESPV
ncbi:MAG: hypothetical protein IKN36_00860, partial [Clostridia bacterium]|nr:hypothetical protein [Clostridia bacterium]